MKIETDATFYNSIRGFQRSSAFKALASCSWLYYCSYVLKLPQQTNEGSMMGNVCHSVFECLLNPRHYHFHKKLLTANTVKVSRPIERLVWRFMFKNNLPPKQETFDKIDGMILVGLKTDFLVKGGKIVGREYRFQLRNEEPKYSICGTIDKIATKDDTIIIDDFKSSKKKYAGEDKESNIQALFYSLAAKKIWPALKPVVRFIFLQYPKEPIMEVKFTDEVLRGFEYYLEKVQKKVDSFTEEDAKTNFAADEEISEKEFKGKIMCGFATKPGQLKKDGTKMWHCPFKFAFDYYVVKNKQGEILHSAFDKSKLKFNESETVEKMHYDGCPRFRNVLNGFDKPQIKKPVNVLDDF